MECFITRKIPHIPESQTGSYLRNWGFRETRADGLCFSSRGTVGWNKNQSVRIMIPIAVVYPVNLAFFILYVSPWNLESSFSGRRDQVLIPAVIFQKSKVFFVPKTFPKIFFYFLQIFLFYFFKLHMLIEG